jgi:hypothetical protein
MAKVFGAVFLLALGACTGVPVAQPVLPVQPVQQVQSACANSAEATYACQVERYNSTGVR